MFTIDLCLVLRNSYVENNNGRKLPEQPFDLRFVHHVHVLKDNLENTERMVERGRILTKIKISLDLLVFSIMRCTLTMVHLQYL